MNKKMLSFIQKMSLIFFSIIFIEILLRLVGFGYNFVNTQNVSKIKKNNTKTVILCIGESTTAWGGHESYPSQLQAMLDKKFGPFKYLVINEGVAATNTSTILADLENKILKYDPNIIVTMMGINDVWALNDDYSYFEDFRLYKLLKLFKYNYKIVLNHYFPSRLDTEARPAQITNSSENTKPDVNHSSEYFNLISKAHNEFVSKNFKNADYFFSLAEKIELVTSYALFEFASVKLELGLKKEAETLFWRYANYYDSALAYRIVGIHYFIKFGATDPDAKLVVRRFLHEALKIDLSDMQANKFLGKSYGAENGQEEQALKYLLVPYKAGIRDFDIISSIAAIYKRQNKNTEEAEILKTGLYEKEDVIWLWIDLIKNYLRTKNFSDAEKYINFGLEYLSDNPKIVDLKVELFKLTNRDFSKIKQYTVKNYYEYPITRSNYLKIAKLIENYKIKHVVMQYPRREISPLKELLSDFNNISYIENKDTFESILRDHPYNYLFTDSFGDDFGHFTLIGSQTIVGQIMKSLTDENIFY